MIERLYEYRETGQDRHTSLEWCLECRVYHEWDEMGQRQPCKHSKLYQINDVYAEMIVRELAQELIKKRNTR
jgi:hypothetical protein